MTQEEKDLLLKDLCARLRSRIWVKIGEFSDYTLVGYDSVKDTFTVELVDNHSLPNYITDVPAHHMKPYLRPMSSMTEEERGQYMEFIEWSHNDYDGTTTTCIIKEKLHEYLDFIYSHHFDDNGLIEKGLALEAKEGMY